MNKKLKITYDEAAPSPRGTNILADITKVSDAFDWKPKVTIEEGLKHTIEANLF
jgi:nucleoside-diphosphate-sugar epimerase